MGKFIKILFAVLLCSTSVFGQVDYFNVDGNWAGNDANGNAVIKWRITICTGQDSSTNVVVKVPSLERNETQSGGIGIADEDSPADDQVCTGTWDGGYNTYRPSNFKTTGILLDIPKFPRNTCRVYTWTTYSKDYDSSANDYDHYVIANWSSDGFPDPGFVCGTDGFIDCDNTSTSTTDPKCVDQIDCDDVATNNYEQILGLAYDIVDGPNFQSDCSDGDYAFDMTWNYVVCHHGESDYDAGCDKTAPGETGTVDIMPDAITNVLIYSNIVQVFESRGASVTDIQVTNPGTNQFLVINPSFNGDTEQRLTESSSTIPPGIDEMLDGNEPTTTSASCMASQPTCDTLAIYLEWRPNDLTDMFNSSTEGFNCDETGNINVGNAAVTSNLYYYWHQPTVRDYIPLNGYQNAGTSVGEYAPWEVGHVGLDPDPEFGDCNSSAFSTCAAGPAEDCSGKSIPMGYYSEISLVKNTLQVEPNFSDPNYFDVTFELIFTNEGEVNLINPTLLDDLVMTFDGDASGYILPFVTPPTIDASVVPAPSVGGGFPTINSSYDGNGVIEILDGNGGIIEPGESVRITFEVTVDRDVLGDDEYTNQSQVNSPDCFGMMSSDIWCVGDIDESMLQLFSIDVALAKTTVTPGPYVLGQTVTFNLEVINQGTADLQNVEVTDFIPCGFIYAPSNNPTWTLNGTKATTEIQSLPMGTSTDVTIDLIIQSCDLTNAFLNVAEVSYMEDEYGRDVSMVDFDSMSDSNPDNDAGGAADTDTDDSVNGNGEGNPGDTNAAEDEDDHDIELIEIFDLALDKILVTAPPYMYNQVLEFQITVYNQGNSPVTQVEVTDYLPDGFSYNAMDNLLVWLPSGSNLEYTIPGPIAAGSFQTLSLFLRLEQASTADAYYNEAEISSFADDQGAVATDLDSSPDNDPDNDNDVEIGSDDDNEILESGGLGQDEDDNDPAEPMIADAAITKSTTDMGPYRYGDVITFDIDVTNQGNVTLTDIQVIDYLPCGFAYVGGNVGWASLGSNYVTNINGPVLPGATVSLTMEVEIISCGDDGAYQNEVEIYGMSDTEGMPLDDIDSTPDTNPMNDAGGEPNSSTDDVTDNTDGDEDDHDPHLIEIYDLALKKTISTPAPYSYGQTIVFDIEIFNQGNTNISNIDIYDEIPSGYSYNESTGVNPTYNWSTGPNPTTTIAGPLLAGDSITIQIEMVILANPGADDAYVNYAEISSMQDDMNNIVIDADSSPDSNPSNDGGGEAGGDTDDVIDNSNGDEDDQDPALIEIFDLAITKSTIGSGPYTYGDIVSYNITVINQGTVTANNIEIIDYLPCGLEFSTTNFPEWIFDSADNEAITIIDEPLAPGADTIITIDAIVIACEGADSYTNYIEIFGVTDENGGPVIDIDSTPDDDPSDDAGGNVDDSTNDQIDGDGTDDEDDHDPAIIEIFDLALSKILVTPPTYEYGDLLIFEITVKNQGNVEATEIEVIDYIPPGFSYDPMETVNMSNGWSAGPNPTTTISGPLAPEGTAIVSIALTFENTAGGTDQWINYAEIQSALDGEGMTQVDADSTPDNDSGNDNDVVPGDPDDDNIDGNGPNGPNGPEDEDDHDPAGPTVVDMALNKTTTAVGPFSYGQIITYQIEVFNQGNVTTSQIKVIDYIPSGLQYVGSNFPQWTFDSFSGNATTEINQDIAPGESVILYIDLQVVPTTDFEDGWTNYAEIYEFEDDDGNNITNQDVDSDADTTNGNDAGGEPSGPTDDIVDGNGNGPTGTGIPSEDEDDHDPELIEIFDLALSKTINTLGPYNYGDLVEFSFFVHNQGNIGATNIDITDYLPVGYSFDATNLGNTGWNTVGTNLVYTITDIIAPASNIEVKLYLTIEMSAGGEKDWINYSEITAAENENGDDRTLWDIDSTPGSDGAGENAVEPGDPADDDVTSNDPGGEEDDHDPAGIEIFDLAQTKTTLETGPFVYGQEVLFTVTVYNQGSIEASGIEITDYLPCGLSYVSSNDANGWSYDSMSGNATVTLPGTLAAGASTTIDITLEVVQCIDSEATSFTNVTEITGSASEDPDEPADDIDSTEDTDPDNDGPVTDDEVDGDPNDPTNPDEDDSDPEVIEVFDLALIKTIVTPGPYAYGDLVEFEFTVCNQGNVDAQSIEVTDYLPVGYSFDSGLASNTGWLTSGSNLVYAVPGILVQDDCRTFSLFLTIEMSNGGEKDWVNYSEITSADNDADPNNTPPVDADSTPGSNGAGENAIEPNETGDDDLNSVDPGGNEDDHDPAGIEIFDLAQTKTTLETGPFVYGQEVLYTVTVYNQGSIEASGIAITDYLPCGLSYVNSNDANGWIYDATSGNATVTLPGTLAAGESTTIDLTLQIIPCYTDEAGAYTNVTEITGSESEDPNEPADDIDSTEDTDPDNDGPVTDDEVDGDPNNPTNPDEDDSDPEIIEVFDLAQIKFIDNEGPYDIGEIATFEFEITNQGNVNAYNIEITDYLNEGFSFSTIGNDGWTTAGDNLIYTIEGPLTPGETVTLFLDLTVILPDNASVQSWYNESEISSADNDTDPTNEYPVDADSTPDNDPDNDNDLVDGPDEDPIFNPNDDNDNVIDENPSDPFGLGDDDEDDNDAAGILVVGGLGDTVWKDLDGDGVQDDDEPGVQGVVVILTDCEGNFIDMEVTDMDGFYFFNNLIPGEYQVQFDISGLPEGCAFTYQDQGGNDELDSDVDQFGLAPCTMISGGEYDSTFDAGLLILASLGDFVWHDLDGDGIQDGGEPGIEGVTVNLYNEDGELVSTTTTDENGYYLFEYLYPDTYFVEFIDPDGFDSTFSEQGNNDGLDSDITNEVIIQDGGSTTDLYILGPGENNLSIDAGYYMCIPIGETVWYDVNTNDVEDPNENGINGMLVTLWRYHNGTWVEWDEMYTGHKPGTPSDDGYYKFCAPPGRYYVKFQLPPIGLVQAQPNVGSDLLDSDVTNANGLGTTNSFTVLSGEELCTIGAGYYPMAEVGNFVWEDLNQNGVQEEGEAPLEGIVVQAFNLNDEMITQVTTDDKGEYNMDYLRQESYYLKFTPPAGYGATVANAGDDEKDSDVTHAYGANTTNAYALNSGDQVRNVDAGMALGVLPVEWLYVKANNRGDHNLVEWATATEINSDYFEVERRVGNEPSFRSIAKVAAAGMSTDKVEYEYKDLEIEQVGVYYYRIKQIDTDGRIDFSDIVSVTLDKGATTMNLYPNPTSNTTMIKVSGSDAQDAKVSVFTKDGKLIRSGLILDEISTGNYELRLDVSTFLPGVYTVQIETTHDTWTEKLIVIK